jgi:hypothetical protein
METQISISFVLAVILTQDTKTKIITVSNFYSDFNTHAGKCVSTPVKFVPLWELLVNVETGHVLDPRFIGSKIKYPCTEI